MSRLSMNLTRPSGSVGSAVQCFEPKRPFSSPSKHTNRIERRGAIGKLEKARANSSTPEVPLALSSAPG